MDKETLEKLLEVQPKEIRSKGVLLFNGAASCALTYQNAPNTANLRDWESAQAALAKFAAELGATEDSDKPLLTIAAVLDYLKESDWKVTKTSLHRHHKDGKLLPRTDGTYQIKDIERYARTWLRQQSTGKRKQEKMDEIQRDKLEQELKNLKLDYDKKLLSFDKDLGKYILKERMEVELASRAGALNAGLKHWVQSHAAEWIRTAGGDTKHAGVLINLMVHDLDEHINGYANMSEYEIIVDAEEEAADEVPETGEEPTREEEEYDGCK